MDANKKNFIQKKLNGMDDQYWMKAVEHLSISSNQLDMLYEQQKAAFTSYCVACFEIVEAKYYGYLALLADELSVADEVAIENEYKLKLKNLELERQGYIKQIEGLHSQLFGFTQQPLPLEKYDNDLIHKEAI